MENREALLAGDEFGGVVWVAEAEREFFERKRLVGGNHGPHLGGIDVRQLAVRRARGQSFGGHAHRAPPPTRFRAKSASIISRAVRAAA